MVMVTGLGPRDNGDFSIDAQDPQEAFAAH